MYRSSATSNWRTAALRRPSPPKPVPTSIPKKWIPMLALFTVGLMVWGFQNLSITWRRAPQDAEIIQFEKGDHAERVAVHGDGAATKPSYNKKEHGVVATDFQPGKVKPIGEPYTKMIVIPRILSEDVSWVEESFGGDPHISYSIYTADDPSALLHPPKNKGHEVMIYLSYIIDHYNNLSDVNIFMHSHKSGWHNNELLELDAVQTVGRLSAERVQREGYMNMRCHWEPGCPSWMHPGNVEEDINKQEESMLAKSWSDLFPLDPIPETLAQPCCAQYAVSRDRIQSIPLARYVFYRDWLLHTQLSDYISGRVWEYIWQFVFTGKHVVCPKEHVCYCDGFGVCFGGQAEYENYWEINRKKEELKNQLEAWQIHQDIYKNLVVQGKFQEAQNMGIPTEGQDVEMRGQIEKLQKWLDNTLLEAKKHGDVAMNRAKEAGRHWSDGDGF